MNIPVMIGSGAITRRAGPYQTKPKGLWYWLIVAPIKYMMILVFGMFAISLAIAVAMIAFIPWAIIRSLQHKSLKPDFLVNAKKGKVVK